MGTNLNNKVYLIFTIFYKTVKDGNSEIETFVMVDKETKDFPCLQLCKDNGNTLVDHYTKILTDLTEYSPEYFPVKMVEVIVNDDDCLDVYYSTSISMSNVGMDRKKLLNTFAYDLVSVREDNQYEKANFRPDLLLKAIGWNRPGGNGGNPAASGEEKAKDEGSA